MDCRKTPEGLHRNMPRAKLQTARHVSYSKSTIITASFPFGGGHCIYRVPVFMAFLSSGGSSMADSIESSRALHTTYRARRPDVHTLPLHMRSERNAFYSSLSLMGGTHETLRIRSAARLLCILASQAVSSQTDYVGVAHPWSLGEGFPCMANVHFEICHREGDRRMQVRWLRGRRCARM